MEVLLCADSMQELRVSLAQIDINVPERSEGRRNSHVERYCIAHLLASLPGKNFSFPLTLTHTDRPDFVLSMPGVDWGIEHTEAIPENVARAEHLRGKGLGPDVYFTPHAIPGESRKTVAELRAQTENDDAGDGWEGDSAEQEWAAAMAHHIKEKKIKASAEGFTLHDCNWLLIYDNWPLPGVDILKAASLLNQLLEELDAFNVFDKIYVLNDSRLCEFGVGKCVVIHPLVDPSLGS
jgi:hypothetical protein